MSLCYISPQQKEWGFSELTQDFKKKSHNKVTGFSHPGVREGDSTDLQMKSKNPHFEVHSPGTTTAKFYMKFQKLSMHIQKKYVLFVCFFILFWNQDFREKYQ